MSNIAARPGTGDTTKTERLETRWREAIKARPQLRIRDVAEEFGVSELELLCLPSQADRIVPLSHQWAKLIGELQTVGPLMALSRNNFAVHEKTGDYTGLRGNQHMGLIINGAIDLRFFFQRWAHGYVVKSATVEDSLQFFSADGTAVHKIYCTENTDKKAWQRVLLKFGSAASGRPRIEARPLPEKKSTVFDSGTQAQVLQRWAQLSDVHQFYRLLKDFELSRYQAMELAQEQWTFAVSASIVPAFISGLTGTGIPVMVFVPNEGIVQIHTGPIERCLQRGAWFNILDPGFSLHLNTAGMEQAWIVRKPTSDGIVSSLEIYDIDGELVMQMFGARAEGCAELNSWRRQLEMLCPDIPAHSS